MSQSVAIKDYSAEHTAEALEAITRIGVRMLRSGASSSRTKDTMDRVAAILGIEHFETFVTPTKIISIIYGKQGSFTRAMRVPLLGVNMSAMSKIRTLILETKEMTPDALKTWLDALESEKLNYTTAVVAVAVAIACGCFAIILGGGLLEAIGAALGAAVAQIARVTLDRRHVNPYIITAFGAFVASLISYAVMKAIGAPTPRIGLIASVLLLVPGVPLVTALLDLLHLDLISGLARGVYAIMLVVNIGVGMLVVLALTGFSIL
ncbi:MAG TPA: threonine/serine exporter family protein [Aggregatilineales bacterium]|nr:threonine/serine exporter family protein [Aggregatilineales bacterium]